MTCAHAATASNETVIKLNNEGVKKINSGDYKGAVNCFSEAVKKAPDYDLGYYNRIIANHHLKNYATIIADFETLKKIPSGNPDLVYLPFIDDAYADQTLNRQKSGDMAGALKSLEKANLYSPGMAEYLHYRAVARQATGDSKGANEDLETEKQSFSLKSRD